jgi:phytanoyl-CoA hydroxylase
MITAQPPTAAAIDAYRRDGFARIRNLISPETALRLRAAALAAADAEQSSARRRDPVFDQHVNVWQRHPALAELVLHPDFAAVTEAYAGTGLRLWHDHLLIKRQGVSKATEFHQDKPYWPFVDDASSAHPISCWIALGDVPVERGCMSFIPGSHRLGGLRPQKLSDPGDFFSLAPELAWDSRVTVPLRAGDCTVHHGLTAHMAFPNSTDEARVAMVVIFIDRTTIYDGRKHVVTDSYGRLAVGDRIAGDWFPVTSTAA